MWLTMVGVREAKLCKVRCIVGRRNGRYSVKALKTRETPMGEMLDTSEFVMEISARDQNTYDGSHMIEHEFSIIYNHTTIVVVHRVRPSWDWVRGKDVVANVG